MAATAQDSPPPQAWWRESRAVLAVMAVSLSAKLILASLYYGFLAGDDAEVVQAAAKYAFGFEYQPWSLRCLFHPALLVAPLVKALGGAGPSVDPIRGAGASSVPAILASTASIWMVFRLAQSLAAPRPTAVLASALYATHWLPLSYGSMPFPRPISTMFFLAALLAAVEPSRVRAFLGGALVAAAFAVRFSEGILSLPFCGSSGAGTGRRPSWRSALPAGSLAAVSSSVSST